MEQLTDSQKLDLLNKRLKRMEISQNIQTMVVILGFVGIVSLGTLLAKVKSKINGN